MSHGECPLTTTPAQQLKQFLQNANMLTVHQLPILHQVKLTFHYGLHALSDLAPNYNIIIPPPNASVPVVFFCSEHTKLTPTSPCTCYSFCLLHTSPGLVTCWFLLNNVSVQMSSHLSYQNQSLGGSLPSVLSAGIFPGCNLWFSIYVYLLLSISLTRR